MAKKDSLTEHLKTHFGFDTFKGNQKAIIENVLAGNDTFVLISCTGKKRSRVIPLEALLFLFLLISDSCQLLLTCTLCVGAWFSLR